MSLRYGAVIFGDLTHPPYVTAYSLFAEEFYEFLYCAASVADGVFFVCIHLGEGAAVGFVGLENWVVAKSAVAMLFGEDMSFHTAIENVEFAIQNQCHGSAEARCAFLHRHALHLIKHFTHICFTVVPGTSISGTIHAWFTAQRINFKTGVVAEAVVAVVIFYEASLLLSVAFNGGASFGNIVVAIDVGQTQDAEFLANHAADFLQLMGVVGCEN